jgi:glycosyltransferase involved in cell wall biosynthesis
MKTAIVHYWLVNMRGGEKVLEALLEIFPDADIYTHVYNPENVSEIIRSHNVYTTYINRLPLAKKFYQKYMPLMPGALEELNLNDYDLVISSESGPAKGIVPNPDAFHICYCHSPMRYLWDMYHEYFREAGPLVRFFMKRLIPGLRLWDIMSANMVDHFIANSSYVAKRIQRYYGRGADIVYPPVDIKKYISIERRPENFYLFFGQMTGYKRADIAIDACIKSGRRLVLIGAGTDKKTLRKYRNNSLIHFAGKVTDEDAAAYLSRARALIFPGIEDFGIIPVEAQAAGCPVIGYRKGGALDTVKENVTGIFFNEQTSKSLIEALDFFESKSEDFWDREAFIHHIRQFSKEVFIGKMSQIIAERKRL